MTISLLFLAHYVLMKVQNQLQLKRKRELLIIPGVMKNNTIRTRKGNFEKEVE